MLADQRTALSDILQQLLKQKDQREEELRMVLVSDYGPTFLLSQKRHLKLDQLTETFHMLWSLLQKSHLGHTNIAKNSILNLG